MAVRIDRDGYFEITYSDFSGGLDVQSPESEIPDNSTTAAVNFQVRNRELRSRPAFSLKFAGMDGSPILGVFSFIDANGITHTVAWNGRGLWQLAPSGLPPGALSPWSFIGPPSLVAGNPVSYKAFAQTLYYCNGGSLLASWDGISNSPTASNASIANSTSIAAVSVADAQTVLGGPPPTAVGPLSLGGLFLGELDNHLLMANITLVDNGNGTVYTFPNRLWWSQNGVPTQWDFAANTNAGENDFLDVPDAITGLGTVGTSGFLFRSNGITFFDPTGNGLSPFQFDHLWASDHGIGNVFPWSIHFYGSHGFFVSAEDVYRIGVASFEAVGGEARDAIMADLALATGNPVGSVVPTENLGYIYFTYRISIPLGSFTRHYVYSVEKKNWMTWDVSGLIQTAREEEVWTGLLATLPVGAQPAGTGTQGAGGGGPGVPGGGGPSGGPRLRQL